MSQEAQVPPGNRWKRLGDLLLDAGLITQGQLSEGLAEKERQKCFLGQALVMLGYISQDELISFLVKQCKIPHISLADYSIDPRIVRLLPADLCRRYKLMAIDKLGSILTVCMVNPLDMDALEEARQACPELRLKPILCTPEHFEAAARQHLPGTENPTKPTPSADVSLASFGLTAPSAKKASAAPVVSEPPVAPREPVPAGESFSHLVRDVLAELLSTFQGPVQGRPESAEGVWSSVEHSAAQFLFTLDPSGNLCYVNPSVTAVLGYSPEVFQERFLQLLTDHPENAILRQAITLSLSGRQRPPLETEFLGHDGTVHTLIIALIPVFDGAQQLVAVQGVARDITRRAAAEQSLYLAATQDPLTGLLNRRSFLCRLRELVLVSKRHGTPVSIAVVNVDNFTQVNEAHGHAEGDAVLRQVGHILRNTLRGEDLVARSGGDEFCILMPHVPPEQGQHGMGRYKDALTGAEFLTASGERLQLTVTAGFATVDNPDQPPEAMLEQARALVQQGKVAGGNQVILKREE